MQRKLFIKPPKNLMKKNSKKLLIFHNTNKRQENMKARYEKSVTFPCGYTYYENVDVSTRITEFGRINSEVNNELPICPLHGKKCKSGGKII